ncbi:sensor histidine kinase [Catelliglobosispora koreensis]|uniref:sensor histidine kinase n=1 Tax=Catelliglobosispora koreensis TaxID=129052 RepID=UPI00036F0F60|nr:histidine kinase [Catelliglobosispora koreensis]
MPAPPRVHELSEEQLHPPLRTWSRLWRYLLAASAGVAAWIASALVMLSSPMTPAQEDVVGAALFLDFGLGVAALAMLPLRRRFPLAVACLTAVASVASATAMGPATVALVSMATWRRRAWVVAAAVVFTAGAVVSEVAYRPRLSPAEDSALDIAGGIVLSVAFFAAAIATGYYIAARRELVATLRERLAAAEREQALTAQVERDAERNRIAREMHDVLAHRISLVAMHSGALAYREDLDRAQTAATAQTIQANAQLALTELRQVLGVLRAGHPALAVPEAQPTLAELPALIADAREAGTDVRLDASGLQTPPGKLMPQALSLTAFRIVQEALTNARKHAPGQLVTVRLAGVPGSGLEVEIRNLVGTKANPDFTPAGVGLTGLAERADLAGGTFECGQRADGYFVVQANLPWNE